MAKKETKLEMTEFDKALFTFFDIDSVKSLPNSSTLFSKGFIYILDKYKSITPDIFAAYHFIDEEETGVLQSKICSDCLFTKILEMLKKEDLTLQNLIKIIEEEIKNELNNKISVEEIFLTFILLFYIYLQENVWGPSFVFIKETEKVDFKKELDKFNNNYFNKLLVNKNYEPIREEIISEFSSFGEEPYKYSKFVVLYYIAYYFVTKNEYFTKQIEKIYVANIWKMRLLFVLNKLINEPIDEINKKIKALYEVINIDALPDDLKIIKGYLTIEKSYYHIRYHNYKECKQMIDKANDFLELDISLTGKMGKKTKYQEFETPVLVVSVENKNTNTDLEKTFENKMTLDEINKDNPLLENPRLTNEEEEKKYQSQVITLKDQIYIISLLNYFKKGLADEDVRREVILSYSEKALKTSYNWLVFSKLLLSRSKAEDKISKKVERALLQIEALCNQYNDRNPTPYERLAYFFIIDYPMIFSLKKDYAECFMSYGAVMTACDVFKELRMWEETIKCLYVANNRTEAKDLAKKVLAEHEEPGVYCLLGELENNVDYFHKALEISKNKYTRAYRCLGRYYFIKQNEPKSLEYYEKAMSINPVFPDIWFTMGSMYLKSKQYQKALISYSKMLSLDDSSHEVWGNLGVCFIQFKKYKEAIKCFEEGFARGRNSWRLLDNLAFVAVESKEITKLIFAMENFYLIKEGDKLKPGYFYYLTKLYLVSYTTYTDHDREYFKKKIYQLFNQFGEADGLKAEVWDLYANFIEEVEINRVKEDPNKVYKEIIEIRLKELRSLMLKDWEKDPKLRDILKTVVASMRAVIAKITNDEMYVKDKTFFLNSIDNKIINAEKENK